jgi:thioredoxin 1
MDNKSGLRNRYVIELNGTQIGKMLFDAVVPIVIEFCSASSGAGHIMSPCFDNLAKNYAQRACFYRVNIDINPEPADKFDVTTVPCFGFFVKGKMVKRLFGVTPKSELEDAVTQTLAKAV